MRPSTKSTHTLFSNLGFYARIWAKIFPLGLVLIPLYAVVAIVVAYVNIAIPRTIVATLEEMGSVHSLLLALIRPFIFLIAGKILQALLTTFLMARAAHPMLFLNSTCINDKILSLHYQTLTSPAVQAKLNQAKTIALAGDGHAIQLVGLNMAELLTAVGGAAFFASHIVAVDRLLFAVILLSAGINLFYGFYVGRAVDRNVAARSEDEKKENYLLRVLEQPKYAKDIRLHNMKDWLHRKLLEHYERVSVSLRRENKLRYGAVVLSALFLLVRDLLAYVYLVLLLSQGSISIAHFVFLLGLIFQFSLWMNLLVQKVNQLISFSTMLNQVRSFLDVQETVDPTAFGEAKAIEVARKPSIEFCNMSFRYPESEHWIFKDFNLKIRGGERLAIVGINGAGKTTLMHLLMGLLHPTEGDIRIDGRSYREFAPSEYYALFSPLFQDIQIFPESVLDNITGAPGSAMRAEHPGDERLQAALRASGMDRILPGLPDGGATFLVKNSKDEAIDLSGGQNQRLLLARALYKNAPICILDEPTAALDPIAECELYEEFDRVSRHQTSIFISHRLASTRFCDQVILLEHGRILEQGTHDELMRRGASYRAMYDVQSRYYQEVDYA